MLLDESMLLTLKCTFQRCSCLPDSFLSPKKYFVVHPELQMAELGTRIPKYILARDTKSIETFSTYLISSTHTAVDFVALQTDKVQPMVLKSL